MERRSVPDRVVAVFGIVVAAAVVAAFLLIVVGGLVRASEAGLGCPDWPLCYGQAIPAQRLHGATLLEFSHRVVSAFVGLLVVITAVMAWRYYRHEAWIVRPALWAVALLLIQIILGGVTVLLELPPALVGVHLAVALLLLACLITTALYILKPWPAEQMSPNQSDRLLRLAQGAVVATFALIVSGTVVAGAEAEHACLTWPLCGSQVLPTDALALINMLHRYVAGAAGLYSIYVLVQAWRSRRGIRSVVVAAWAAGLLLVTQVIIGAVNVVLNYPVVTNVLHLASAAALWAAVVVLTVLIKETNPTPLSVLTRAQRPIDAPTGSTTMSASGPVTSRESPLQAKDAWSMADAVSSSVAVAQALTPRLVLLPVTTYVLTRAHGLRDRLGVYILLTKPWVVALLVATTLGAMVLAQGGVPPLRLLLLTLLGGWLAAAGSSALNSYIDRDIDGQMARTARRPLPSGVLEPQNALIFGLILTVLGLAILALFVNALSATLALLGSLYYVVVYTLVLKRTTPQSVVIGGLAGALPPLVGWAAVAGRLDTLAFLLALIIFLWTPPHTWALVLMVTKDYERVGVPMLPVAYGPAETRRQIVFYSILLAVAALLPYLLHELGLAYVIMALLLNLRFVHLAVKLWREQSKAVARRLYRYSTVFLALMFLVMVVDRVALHVYL